MAKTNKEEETKVEKPAKKKAAGKYTGKELTVKIGKVEHKGLCTSERDTNSGKQVYLKISGQVARYFNVEDIVK